MESALLLKEETQGDTLVTRLVCASLSRIQGSVMDQLFAIREQQSKLAGQATVHCALLYASGWFVIWLEGSEAQVEAARIACQRDSRNERQIVIHRSVGPAGLSEPFSVATTQVPVSSSAFGHRVMRVKDGKVAHSGPDAVWNYLSAPCTMTLSEQDKARPCQRVAVISAEDNGPIDVLRTLGRGVVAYQRFANAHSRSSDVGVAYVDFRAASERVRRVVLLSRRALAHELVRKSIASIDSLVLLLGARQTAAVELAQIVSSCLQAIPGRPVVHLVAPDEAAARPAAEVLAGAPAAAVRWLPGDDIAAFLRTSG